MMRRRGSAWTVAVLVAMAGWLAGCAAAPAGQGGQGTRDWVTASDEPQARQRAGVRLELAAGYFEKNLYTVALDEVKRALVLDPTLVPALNLRGLIYMALNEPVLAQESFQQALQRAPQDGDTLHNLGWFHCQAGRLPDAVAAFERALVAPRYTALARTWMVLGVCQAKAGLVAEAERSLLRAHELDANHPITLYNLALLMHQRGESERARTHIRRLNNSELANAGSLWLGIKIENRLRNAEAARQLGVQLSRRFPDSPEADSLARGAFNE